MKKVFAIIASVAFFGAPLAQAQDAAPAPEAVAEPETVRAEVDKETCRRVLVEHVPDPGVNYTPGVDVYGNPVKGADLHDYSGVLAAMPSTFEFDLSFAPVKNGLLADNTTMSVGTVKFDIMSGKLTYNGVSMTDDQQDELVKACREAGQKR